MRKVASSCLSTTWLSQILSNSVRGLLMSPDPRPIAVGQPTGSAEADRATRYYDFLAFFALFAGAAAASAAPASAGTAAAESGAVASAPAAAVSRARSVMRAALPVSPRR